MSNNLLKKMSLRQKQSLSCIMTHEKCAPVSVPAENLPPACILLFYCVQDVSGDQP